MSMSNNDIFMYVQVINMVASLTIAFFMYRITQKQRIFEEKVEIKNRTPFIYLNKILFIKNKWIRYSKEVDVPEYIPYKNYNKMDEEEKQYVDCCLKEENRGKVYFTYFQNNLILVANMCSRMPTVFIEHNSAEVVLSSYGEMIVKLEINNIEIHLLNGKEIILPPGKNNCYSGIISKGDDITIIFDEATDSLENSFCNISKETYDKLSDTDMFIKNHESLIHYSRLIFNISLYNMYNEEFKYQIIIEKKDNNIERKVEPIK